MDRFVARQNIEHLREALLKETDQTKRKVLELLLSEQEEELKAANKRHDHQADQDRNESGGT